MKKLIVLTFLQIGLLASAQTTLRFDKPTYSVVNNKPVATFTVNSPGGSLYTSCWIQGVRHPDGTYSTYTLQVDDTYYTYTVTQATADWGYSNLMPIYLNYGTHQLHIYSNSLDDVPNVESLYMCTAPIPPSGTSYQDMKAHSQTTVSVGNSYAIHISYTTQSPFTAYVADRDLAVYYTFFRKEYYTEGDTVRVNITDVDLNYDFGNIYVSMFSGESFSTFRPESWSVDGQYYEFYISQTGFYQLLVSTASNDIWGTCWFNVNGERYFDEVPVCCCITPLTNEFVDSGRTCFSIGKNGDMMSFLMTHDRGVFFFCDDASFGSTYTSIDWGKNPCTRARMYPSQQHFSSLFNSLPQTSYAATADIYTGLGIADNSNYLSSSQFNTNYPNYKAYDKMISAPASSSYDAMGWAFNWLGHVGYWAMNLDDEEELEWLEAQANDYGYTMVGATEENSAIDVYQNEAGLSLATARSKSHYYAAGYGWESKLGDHERVFHPRYALQGGSAGYVGCHLIRDTNAQMSESGLPCELCVVENAELSDAEREIISNGIEGISISIKEGFDRLWTCCKEEGKWRSFISLRQYELLGHYSELLDFCKMNPETFFLVCHLIEDKNEVMAIKLVGDMTAGKYAYLHEAITSESRKRRTTADGRFVNRPVLTEGILYVKGILNEGCLGKAESFISYSSDPMFTVEQNGNTLTISFDLVRDASVTVGVSNPQRNSMQFASRGERMQAGKHQLNITVPETGIYAVGVVINGKVYEKKVIIR